MWRSRRLLDVSYFAEDNYTLSNTTNKVVVSAAVPFEKGFNDTKLLLFAESLSFNIPEIDNTTFSCCGQNFTNLTNILAVRLQNEPLYWRNYSDSDTQQNVTQYADMFCLIPMFMFYVSMQIGGYI